MILPTAHYPPAPVTHAGEPESNADRVAAARVEPRCLRTFTPSQAVIARSAGVYHWTPEGRRLYDFSSGVLVSNLGHNPIRWMERFCQYMGWPTGGFSRAGEGENGSPNGNSGLQSASEPIAPPGYFAAVPMTAYNAFTPVEADATKRLVDSLRRCPGGSRAEQVLWAASGSEAIQKALWAAQARDRTRPMIVATRFGFHGKKGLANAVTGSETDAERDPRVKFIRFPRAE